MKKFLRNIILFAPLVLLSACGGGDPKTDPYKPSEEEWAANIERINTGNMEVTFLMNMGDAGSSTMKMKATATKVQQEATVVGFTSTNLIVKNGDTYVCYYKETRGDWGKEPSSAEEFAELKKGLLPMPLVYSNFEWGDSTHKMTNKEPIVVDEGDGETATFTNVSISVASKQIYTIEADVTSTDGESTQSGHMKASYTYKDATYDIDVPEVE